MLGEYVWENVLNNVCCEGDRKSDRPKTDARATTNDGWRDRFPRFYYGHFFFALRARYQYYHNFTFVIGWHRASVTKPRSFFLRLSPSFPFSTFLRSSFFPRFVLFVYFSLSLSLNPTFSTLFLFFLPSLLFTLSPSSASSAGTDSEDRDPARCSLIFGLCS